MKNFTLINLLLVVFCHSLIYSEVEGKTFRVATFNVSLYREQAGELLKDLAKTGNKQAQNLAEIIQRVRPDVLLLNEFDYDKTEKTLKYFKKNYLEIAHNGTEPIHYDYHFIAPSNTGIASGFDLNNDGQLQKEGPDALGFGLYPGQFGMALLSRYPIVRKKVRTFQKFLWRDMPHALLPKKRKNKPWYTKQELNIFRLSSKSHWDVAVKVGHINVHFLASHPTPPVFDGPEDCNGKRNHDEIRFWGDYTSKQGKYIYDDNGKHGDLGSNKRFVILGDLNACRFEKDAIKEGIAKLLDSPFINSKFKPQSTGAIKNAPGNPLAPYHTAHWRLRADYVLPSQFGMKVVDGGVFWPDRGSEYSYLVHPRFSSDHFLVYLDLKLTK